MQTSDMRIVTSPCISLHKYVYSANNRKNHLLEIAIFVMQTMPAATCVYCAGTCAPVHTLCDGCGAAYCRRQCTLADTAQCCGCGLVLCGACSAAGLVLATPTHLWVCAACVRGQRVSPAGVIGGRQLFPAGALPTPNPHYSP